ncbi:MAG TPA: hypothetical protein VLJ86_23750, partial [Ramlibacter sp.]|nr:hypothetical protein [Ramlibacter sp.]
CARAQKDIEASIARGGDVSIKALGELTERLCQVAGAVSPDMFGLLVGRGQGFQGAHREGRSPRWR